MRAHLPVWLLWYQPLTTGFLVAAVLSSLPGAVRRPRQRLLWGGVALAAVAMVLDLPLVRHTSGPYGAPWALPLVRNAAGVLSAGAVLLFVARAADKPRLRAAVRAGAPIALAVLSALVLAERSRGPTLVDGVLRVTHSALYWLVLGGIHLAANAACATLCLRHGRRTADRGLGLSLGLFGAGAVCAGIYWAGRLAAVLTPASLPGEGAALRLVIGLHAVLRGAALLVPLLGAARRAAADARALWRLWPLWHELVRASPQVVLDRYPSRCAELLAPPSHWRFLAYRKVIETRDAVLVLRDRAGPAALDCPQRRPADPPDSDEADRPACLLGGGCAQQPRFAPPAAPRTGPAGDGATAVTAEVAFLLHAAHHCPALRLFRSGAAPGKDDGRRTV
ncbi:MAB_1171c family putative transporter [Streptomyces sp. PsTaAH-124]|uniref:MAB_1171c family putative transporter n=1 Tax=Streptomyces sp. PsTaAH-124 TaxID=1157638 RepID=UPI00037B4319|nr:MAB_1171c family putative transporter [Streptomyces sp. PsTaAH-124]